MMQQLATQSSTIAALPDAQTKQDTELASHLLPVSKAPVGDESQNAKAFADVLSERQLKTQVTSKPPVSETTTNTHVNHSSTNEDVDALTLVADERLPEQQKTFSTQQQQGDEFVSVAHLHDCPELPAEFISLDETASDTEATSTLDHTQDTSLALFDPAMTEETSSLVKEPDYLAMVDAIRNIEQRFTGSLQNNNVNTEDHREHSGDIAPKELTPKELVAETVTNESALLTLEEAAQQVQEVLNELLALQPNSESETVQSTEQLQLAQQTLSDLLLVVQEAKNTAKNNTQGAVIEEANAEDAMIQHAVQLLSGLAENGKGERTAKSASDFEKVPLAMRDKNLVIGDIDIQATELASAQRQTSSSETIADENEMSADNNALIAQLLPTEDVANTPQETAIELEVAEDAALHQAELLVSLLKQAASAQPKSSPTNMPIDSVSSDNNPSVNQAIPFEESIAVASDGTLQELAQVVTDSIRQVNPALTDTQLSQVRGQIITGLEEMRTQLKQGHEPGIDLSAVIGEAITVQGIENAQSTVMIAMQDVQQLHQIASLVQMSQGQEQQLSELASVARDLVVNETRQQHSDNLKSLQQQANVDKPVAIHQPQGQQQLAEKIRWMVNGRQSMAEIRLDPPELGSMQVRLNVSGDNASVNFVVQSAQARDVLADAMPRLREMFSEQGLELGESFVNQHSNQNEDQQLADQSQGGGFSDAETSDDASEDSSEDSVHEMSGIRTANGLIDDYV